MFFDSWGRILSRCGEVLRLDIRPEIDDEYLIQQLDAVTVLVSEVGAAWTDLFAALERENRILERALIQARTGATESEAATLGVGGSRSPDPLARNRELLTEIETLVRALHERGDTAALAIARNGLRSAAVVEQELLSEARKRGGMTATRRL